MLIAPALSNKDRIVFPVIISVTKRESTIVLYVFFFTSTITVYCTEIFTSTITLQKALIADVIGIKYGKCVAMAGYLCSPTRPIIIMRVSAEQRAHRRSRGTAFLGLSGRTGGQTDTSHHPPDTQCTQTLREEE